MPRNKHPEKTRALILDTAMRLFRDRGYENTTIQHIADELNGMTRGAVYHHFKSKEDIIDAVTTRMFFERNPFDAAKAQHGLNGLEKIRYAILYQYQDGGAVEINQSAAVLVNNPKYLAQHIISIRDTIAPPLMELIREGIEDGSIRPQDPQCLAEVFLVITNLWLIEPLFPSPRGELEKLCYIRFIFDQMGFPVLSDEVMQRLTQEIQKEENQ